jgi:endonuclease YncB( thermonuclease family)
VEVVVRERYYDRVRERWVPAVKGKRTCRKCRGERMLYNEALAERFLKQAFHPDDPRRRQWRSVRRRWRKRLKETRVGFRRTPKMRYQVNGRYATVRGGRSTLWPLDFKLRRIDGQHEWFLHEPDLHGPFGRGDARVSGTAKIVRVLAGDVFQLEDGTIVRIAGITIPSPDNKIQKNPLLHPDEAARETVRAMLEGKRVELLADKHASLTLDGHAIAFVALAGTDVGEELLRRGVARVHPRHAHMRKTKYQKAQSDARLAGVGCWAR